jgi:uncharacterized protein (DUF2252 family)
MREPLAGSLPTGPIDRASSVDRGLAVRERLPLEAHAECPGGPEGRPGRDPVAVLEAQSVARVPELVPIRYGRMQASPFAFYRGAAGLMADDLGDQPHSGLVTQLCGDAHVGNVGLFASVERRLVFDLNDFDETWPGPFEWDVKRLAASLEVAGRHRGLKRSRRERVVASCVGAYRTAMAEFADEPTMDVWYTRVEVQPGLPRLRKRASRQTVRTAEAVAAKARTRDTEHAAVRLTESGEGGPRFLSDPPLLVPASELLPDDAAQLGSWIDRLIDEYRTSLESDRRLLLDRFRLVDIARKAVGVGSVGTRAWVLLLLDGDGKPLILQAKEAVASVLEPYSVAQGPDNHGQRVVEGQRLMQASSDMLLGWQRIEGVDGVRRDYYVRQFRDWKGSFDLETADANMLEMLGAAAGWTLARAHARSGDRIAIASYLGDDDTFDRALVEFARAYAKRNQHDFNALSGAIASGGVLARRGL